VREKLIPGERSISAVLTDIVRNIQEIVRGEIRLAGSEVREELRSARGAAGLVLAGAVAGAFSVFFLLLAAFTALSRVMVPWAAGVCIAAALAIVALACCGMGLGRLRKARPAQKAPTSVKENLEWAKQRTR
jgi:cytochrome c biogenesis protein CcdA